MAGKGTTEPGYTNRNCQINVGPTDPLRNGTDHEFLSFNRQKRVRFSWAVDLEAAGAE